MTLLTVSGIGKQGDEGFALHNVNFSQRKLQKIVIAGETGSGKSTLLKIIAGLIQPDEGVVMFEEGKVTGERNNLVPGHPGICYLSQDFDLPKFLRVEQVLEYANQRLAQEADLLYEVCRIDHLLQRKTDQLSGGEKQRIAIARLLISSPRLLLLDEPFSNLDRIHRTILKSIIQDISNRLKISIILISHDPEDILSWADQILVMKNGKMVQKGSPAKIYRQPANEYVAGLFGKYTVVEPTSRLFHQLVKKKGSKKRLIVRPEHFKLVSRRKHGLPAKVMSVSFLGGFYEIEAVCLENVLTVRTETPDVDKGDTIYVSYSVSLKK